jgi:hypothetical protein
MYVHFIVLYVHFNVLQGYLIVKQIHLSTVLIDFGFVMFTKIQL